MEYNNWNDILNYEFKQEYFKKINSFLELENNNYTIYPPKDNIYRCFNLTDFNNVKCVILGQDPYFNEGEANGLAFSVDCLKLPPSLKNIYKELFDDLGIIKKDGDLSGWAKEGVLLLNTTLTVRKKEPNSHSKCGWNIFTDNIIKYLNNSSNPICFILWGSNAIAKKKLITNPNHFILTSPHPSPLSSYRGFFGSKPFSKCNKFLTSVGIENIDWSK